MHSDAWGHSWLLLTKPGSSVGLPVATETTNMAQPHKCCRKSVKSDLAKHLLDISVGIFECPLAATSPVNAMSAMREVFRMFRLLPILS